MLQELACADKVIGMKQSKKAILAGRAAKVYLAHDSDPQIQDLFRDLSLRAGVSVNDESTLSQLGKACGINVGAAVVTLLK